jgi:predicted phosphodiesterase
MRTDGIYNLKVVEVPAKYGEAITIYFIGDVHWNSPGFAREKWEYDRERMKREAKHGKVYFILDGDIFESFSTTERRHFIQEGLHDSNKKRWEGEYAREIKQFVRENDFLVGRTLSVYSGNHFFQFYDGTTSDQALARELHAPFIGVCGYTILSLRMDDHHTHVVKVFVHHGRSSGKKPGAMFNALEDAASYFLDADILIMGHNHQMGAIPIPAIRCDMGKGGHWKTKEVHRIAGRSGSYLAAYREGEPSYPVDVMMRPSTLGSLPVKVTPIRFSNNGKGIDNRWVEIESVVRA